MPRSDVSIGEIKEQIRPNVVNLRTPFDYRISKLNSDLIIPAYVHGYSLAIEYMRSWFLEKFPKDYFKTVYVNGKHVLDDYKNFNRDVIKKEKPMVAIVPTVEYDFDRETIDFYEADPSLFLRRTNFQQSFFDDNNTNQHLGVNFQGLRMNFNFRVRVSSRAQQLDLFKRMELMFRIGATESKYISADFHIPKDIMLAIAERAGFAVNREKMIINDVNDFLAYFNSHSEAPILFKLRAINQQPEFFIRVRNLYTHIACKDKLSLDDGERDGQLDNNFHIDMAATLTIPVPHFYAYFSTKPLYHSIVLQEVEGISVGLYSFNDFEIPQENNRGWPQYAITSYICDKGDKVIDISPIFGGHNNLYQVLKWSLKNMTSPNAFIDMQIFRNEDKAKFVRSWVDWEKMELHLVDFVDNENINIVTYADRKYINDTVITIGQYYKDRIDT